jgi:hypothetical protein
VLGARLTVKKDWSVIDRGVNGQPFLWRKNSTNRYLMIDIFNPDTEKRCYSVFSLPKNPYSSEETNGELIGVGCAGSPNVGWDRAYKRARKIAEQYMEKN